MDEHKDSPMLVVIPQKLWRELQACMEDNPNIEKDDVGTFATIICHSAISDYIHSIEKERAKKRR